MTDLAILLLYIWINNKSLENLHRLLGQHIRLLCRSITKDKYFTINELLALIYLFYNSKEFISHSINIKSLYIQCYNRSYRKWIYNSVLMITIYKLHFTFRMIKNKVPKKVSDILTENLKKKKKTLHFTTQYNLRYTKYS